MVLVSAEFSASLKFLLDFVLLLTEADSFICQFRAS